MLEEYPAIVNTKGSIMSQTMVEARAVRKDVASAEGTLSILHDVSLRVLSGESLAITGPSGSGKSTLLGILAGLDVPSSGEVVLARHTLTDMDEEGRAKVRAEHVGFVFKSFQLLPGLTALENVMLPLELHGSKEARTKAQEFLRRVWLRDLVRHYSQKLSGDELLRVAIGRAFSRDPSIFFAVEPTENLDTRIGAHVIDLIFVLNRVPGTTLVLITH